MLAVLVLAAAAGYQLRAPVTPSGVRRSRPACMGGFEQKGLPLAPGERVSLQLKGPAETLKHLTALCRESARSSSVTGIIYDIEWLNRLELIAEGARESLDELVRQASPLPTPPGRRGKPRLNRRRTHCTPPTRCWIPHAASGDAGGTTAAPTTRSSPALGAPCPPFSTSHKPRAACRCPQVKLAESAQGVEVLKMAWQAPVGGYSTDFAVVTLKPKMAASLDVKGDKQCLDYYTRHLKVQTLPTHTSCTRLASAWGSSAAARVLCRF